MSVLTEGIQPDLISPRPPVTLSSPQSSLVEFNKKGILFAQSSETRLEEAIQLENRATQLRDRGEYELAAQAYHQLLEFYQEIGDEEEAQTALRELAKTTLLMEDYDGAIAHFEEIIAQNGGSAPDWVNLGLAFFETGQYAQAEEILQRAIAYWETLRAQSDNNDLDKVTLFEQQAHAYRLQQKVLVAQNKTDAALEMSEWSRARSLVEQLAQNNGAVAPKFPNLNQIKQIAREQQATLVEYSLVGREVRVLGIEPRDETHLYIWVVQPNGNVHFRAVDLQSQEVESMRKLVEDARTTIGLAGRGRRGRRNRRESSLKKLHQLLIAPIAEFLPKDPEARVTFIPEGSLFLVPFAALRDPEGQYLIQHHTLTLSPSIQLLGLTRQQAKPIPLEGEKMLIVGNPTMPSIPLENETLQPLEDLPGAGEEARAIASLFNTTAISGNAATEKAIRQRMSDAAILHFATHGLLDFDADLNAFGEALDPTLPTARESRVYATPGSIIVGDNVFIGGVPANIAFSREKIARVAMPGLLAFAPDPALDSEDGNGFLSAKEITPLNLNAQLAVLSACDTGRGRITGDGVIGLSRAFIAAGVPRVVVSLWSVPDAPTAALMVEFYRNLQQNPDAAQALRQAMLKTQKEYPQPIDWAAFVLVGEP
ncbi:CHAT domain-containing protein [Lusitaniella coriacea LEGE 07157]|uniref:CHAT domain-containing protein n=2 Tax=Lusitaniella TaxID=1983104 RepID=A0A8J7AW10_9CYAN|nr:CHAT domain-containing tetratricopeptide repeat protein [Lusitaniella coriacea]MBE9114342.1 CHAT domain-containing protein [Lusitaniella coriacea LEGE 07157]